MGRWMKRGISEAVAAALILPIILYAVFFAAILAYQEYLASVSFRYLTLTNISCTYDSSNTYVNLSFVANGKYVLAGVEYALPGGSLTPLSTYSCTPSSCVVVNGDFHLYITVPETWAGRLYIMLDFIDGSSKLVIVNSCSST